MNNCISIAILLIFNVLAYGQNDNWHDLSKVEVFSDYNALEGTVVKKALVSDDILAMSGNEIIVGGFIIALDVKTSMNEFLFSRYPQNMCFFCGGAGPETAMQITLKDDKKVKYTKDQIKVKGRLRVEKDDPSGLIYFLEDAEVIKAK